MILLLCVDRIFLTGHTSQLLTLFIYTLGHEFKIKDIGDLHYFLGLKVSKVSFSLYFSHTKYILHILWRNS